jgi:hypothetical protein
MELIKDPRVIKEYDSVKENILRKERDTFIGGLPITLERKDMITLTTGYTVTQKVDGTRVLMFVGPDMAERGSGIKQRKITFIDRRNNFYSLTHQLSRGGTLIHEKLPEYSGTKLLIDGELIFFDDRGQSHDILPLESIKGISFMAFDILYGPISIDTEGVGHEKTVKIGSEGAMAGPIGGKKWTYSDRYEILHKLIVPGYLNNFTPSLSGLFKNTNWFNIEIKPIYYINDITGEGLTNKLKDLTERLEKIKELEKRSREDLNQDEVFLVESLEDTESSIARWKTFKGNLYSLTSNQGALQKDLVKSRKEYYSLIESSLGKKSGIFIKSPVKLDGLIFTPKDAEYILGSWNIPGNTQFKWKPPHDQSIDFLIKKTGKNLGEYGIVELLISKGKDNFEPFRIGNRPAQGLIKKSDFSQVKDLRLNNKKSFTIGEFVYNGEYFVLRNFRPDKDTPNAFFSAINVWKSIQNPVDINDLSLFLNIKQADKKKLKIILNYISRQQLLECIGKNRGLNFMELYMDKLNKQFTEYKQLEDSEFELRLGSITSSGSFSPKLSIHDHNNILGIMVKLNWSQQVFNMVDIQKDNHRTRYLYSDVFSNYIILNSIIKNRISNVDINLKKVFNFDVRSSLSTEKLNPQKVTSEESETFHKERISFKEPSGILTVDITTIQKGTFNDRKFTSSGGKTYQVEIESLVKTGTLDPLIKFIEYLLGQL